MRKDDLIGHKKNYFSQNGEDGIIERIFSIIGAPTKKCCEFGAWDGIHFSNTRRLILNGWRAVLIEGNKERFQQLRQNYVPNERVHCINKYILARPDTLGRVCKRQGFCKLDFLSIDVDGLDFEIFQHLSVHPLVICVEVNSGHYPASVSKINRKIAANNVGQPLGWFVEKAWSLGYSLVCYTGNAFFLREEIRKKFNIPKLDPITAYQQCLCHLTENECGWVFLASFALVEPYYDYNNQLPTRLALHISFFQAVKLILGIKPTYSLVKDKFLRFQVLGRFLIREFYGYRK
ncbi:MAG: FkbM family methyltransferase [Patescibacteria group bacterium]|nr:FkbM family methyltransferase [Patescibacteria group bacterium]MCL5431601.1 FkbM family methyltransferase [Patescibacteria group bacterium]